MRPVHLLCFCERPLCRLVGSLKKAAGGDQHRMPGNHNNSSALHSAACTKARGAPLAPPCTLPTLPLAAERTGVRPPKTQGHSLKSRAVPLAGSQAEHTSALCSPAFCSPAAASPWTTILTAQRRAAHTKGRKSCPIPCATHKSPLCVRQDTNSKADPSCVQHMQYTSTDRAAECSTRLAVQREAAAATRDDMPRPGATCPCPPWASHRKASNRAHHTFNMQTVARR